MAEDVGALLSRVAARDRRAFRALITLVSPRLFGVLLRMLRDRPLAEDALQDVFVKVWNRAYQFDQSRSDGWAWLFGIARHRAIDLLRAQSRKVDVPQDDIDMVECPLPGVERRLEQSERARQVVDCLNALPEARARAVKLTYLSGWTYEQVATHLSMPINTVRTWLRRTLVALKECAENG